jgi:hypothetical protein
LHHCLETIPEPISNQRWTTTPPSPPWAPHPPPPPRRRKKNQRRTSWELALDWLYHGMARFRLVANWAESDFESILITIPIIL